MSSRLVETLGLLSLLGATVTAWAVQERFETAKGPPGALVCRIENGASVPRRVRVEALDGRGHVAADSGVFRLEAGASYLSGGGSVARRCRFTVDERVGLRAHGLVISSEGGVESLVPVLVERSASRRTRGGRSKRGPR